MSAVITNLADELPLVDRMRDALNGELVRRQELLRAAGNYTSALEYEKARAAGAALDPLPSLFVVVDEFSELLAAHREFSLIEYRDAVAAAFGFVNVVCGEQNRVPVVAEAGEVGEECVARRRVKRCGWFVE